jgi:NADH:ubiquinone oxidoreductase subunit F (NADH-binding)
MHSMTFVGKSSELTKQIEGHTICALGDAAAWPIQSVQASLANSCDLRADMTFYLET